MPRLEPHGAETQPVVLITGVSGLIGTRVARELAPDFRVVGLDVERPAEGPLRADDFFECDLTSDRDVERAIGDVAARIGRRVASVIHLAAYYDFSGEPSPLYQKLTVDGTRRLLRSVRKALDAEQLVFSSSLLVMRPAAEGAFLDEASPVRAEWDYPQSKLEAEAVLHEEHGELPVVVLRIAGVYDENGNSPPITQQIWRIREKKLESFFFPGDRSHGQSFVHLDDVASCVRRTVERRGSLDPWEVFLVGEPEIVSYGEMQDLVGELVHGREWPTVRIPAPLAKAGAWIQERVRGDEESFIKPWMIDLADGHYPVRIDRARTRLGWEPRHRLRDALPRMIAQLEADPGRWYATNGLPTASETGTEAREAGDG